MNVTATNNAARNYAVRNAHLSPNYVHVQSDLSSVVRTVVLGLPVTVRKASDVIAGVGHGITR